MNRFVGVVAVVPQAMTIPCRYVMTADGQMWACFILNCGWSILLLTGTFLLARYGAIGVAGARLIAFMIHGCWIYAYVIRSSGMKVAGVRSAEVE